MNRVCHICETVVGAKETCPNCTKMIKILPDPHSMTADQRVAEMQMWNGILEIEFGLMHDRIEKLVGRPVWITEFLAYDSLTEEARNNTGEHPASYDESVSRMIDNLPDSIKDKTIIVEEKENGEINVASFDEWNTDIPDVFKDKD